MSGQRHDVGLRGMRYEKSAESLLGHLASMVKVPSEADFGIDFYCQPLIASGKATKTVAEMCALQVKGGSATLQYGGLKNEKWAEHEIIWLKTLTTPRYLAGVDTSFKTVDLYSLRRLWLVFLKTGIAHNPFSITIASQPKSETPCDPSDAEHKLDDAGHDNWIVDVGAPFLSFNQELMNDESFRAKAIDIWRAWIRIDYLNIMRFHQLVPYYTEQFQYVTNSPISPIRIAHYWDKRKGVNISHLAQNAAPLTISLATHLQWQDDTNAFMFIPILEWLEQNGWLDEMGKGLLKNLQNSQDQGLSPAAIL